ncbi:MAG: twin-arginine translocase TatA/TatE family subunit [Alphaproteobacteria bacterium]
MGGLSFWHILIVALLVVVLFGSNKISGLMGDVAKGIKAFKKGLADDETKTADPKQLQSQTAPPISESKKDETRAS